MSLLPTKPQLVIFDLDGTLFHTHTSIAHCIFRTSQSLHPTLSHLMISFKLLYARGLASNTLSESYTHRHRRIWAIGLRNITWSTKRRAYHLSRLSQALSTSCQLHTSKGSRRSSVAIRVSRQFRLSLDKTVWTNSMISLLRMCQVSNRRLIHRAMKHDCATIWGARS